LFKNHENQIIALNESFFEELGSIFNKMINCDRLSNEITIEHCAELIHLTNKNLRNKFIK